MEDVQLVSVRVAEILGLTTSMTGVKFILADEEEPAGVARLIGHRYCQALMKARHGEHVILDDGITCPAAAAAFGFRPLPEGLKSGKGLVGFGIVSEDETGVKMFEGMTTLPHGRLKSIYLFPIETATIEPDIVVVEDETEKLMWLALAYLNVAGGKRINSSTAILQATCVDATLIPYVNNQFNMSLGCYGCRDATDIGPNETVLGFPFRHFPMIAEYIDFLALKAIPNSRGKHAFSALLKRV